MDQRPARQVLTVIAVALTFASGAMDVASFTRLGTVFTSVMTGNIVLWGLAVARGSLTLASHTAVAIVGYVIGVAAGSRIAVGAGAAAGAGKGRAEDDGRAGGDERNGAWPAHVTWALLAELALLGGFAVGWEITGAKPGGWVQFCLLAVAAAGMGIQSSAVKNMGLAEVSTTYLTGTLTGLVSSLVSPGPAPKDRWRRGGVLLGLAAGASLTGLLVATAPDGVPALPLAALIICVVLASWPPGGGAARSRPALDGAREESGCGLWGGWEMWGDLGRGREWAIWAMGAPGTDRRALGHPWPGDGLTDGPWGTQGPMGASWMGLGAHKARWGPHGWALGHTRPKSAARRLGGGGQVGRVSSGVRSSMRPGPDR
jgi:uncharacterized membrane protein YoaK (UPF0700 family)